MFTSWIKSLDLVGDALLAKGISFARIDGTCSAAHRTAAMAQFRDDPAMRVFLMTTGTGSMGSVTFALSLLHFASALSPSSPLPPFLKLPSVLMTTASFLRRYRTLTLVIILPLPSSSHKSKNGLSSPGRNKSRTGLDTLLTRPSPPCCCRRLNLTMANHVYLLEPQWNPSIEMQAIGRAARLGQTRPVRVVRYVVKHSIEEV